MIACIFGQSTRGIRFYLLIPIIHLIQCIELRKTKNLMIYLSGVGSKQYPRQNKLKQTDDMFFFTINLGDVCYSFNTNQTCAYQTIDIKTDSSMCTLDRNSL